LVVIPNAGMLATINLLEVKIVAELTLILLSIAYTIWRWRRESKKDL
jgi:hypothetical protein